VSCIIIRTRNSSFTLRPRYALCIEWLCVFQRHTARARKKEVPANTGNSNSAVSPAASHVTNVTVQIKGNTMPDRNDCTVNSGSDLKKHVVSPRFSTRQDREGSYDVLLPHLISNPTVFRKGSLKSSPYIYIYIPLNIESYRFPKRKSKV